MTGSETAKVTWRTPLIRLKVLLTALLIAFFCYGFFTWILWPVKVAGQSMMPNYRDGSRHFINKLAYVSAAPQRGDVIGLRRPNGDIYIKRIIGLPGERLDFGSGGIAVNGKPLNEDYVGTTLPASFERALLLHSNEYFVIGDNRATSVFMPVPRADIIGKVVY